MNFLPLPYGTFFVASTGAAWYKADRWNELIIVAVIAGIILGMDMVLLIIATITYIKRRKAFMGTPAFFIPALISGLNLLVLCVTQLHFMKRMIVAAVPVWSHPRFSLQFVPQLFPQPLNPVGQAFGLRPLSSFKSQTYAISQMETIIRIVVDIMVLTRLLALFPDKKQVRTTGILLMTVSAANAFLSIGLGTLSLAIWFKTTSRALYDTLSKISFTQHYSSEVLSLGTNTFATWQLISKWRSIKRVERVVESYYATNRPSDVERRLTFLIVAGFLRGIAQLVYCVVSTIYGILATRPSLLGGLSKLAVSIEFLHYSISALYPIACYLFLHAIHWEEDICHLDLLNIQGDQGRDIPLDDLDTNGHDSTVRDHEDTLINFEEAAVDPLQTDSRHAEESAEFHLRTPSDGGNNSMLNLPRPSRLQL